MESDSARKAAVLSDNGSSKVVKVVVCKSSIVSSVRFGDCKIDDSRSAVGSLIYVLLVLEVWTTSVAQALTQKHADLQSDWLTAYEVANERLAGRR